MWTTRQLLQFSIRLGLRKGLKRIRGARRTFTEEEQDKIAEAIVEDLTRSNWKFEQGPSAVGGSPPFGQGAMMEVTERHL
jgi:hypothetical protein